LEGQGRIALNLKEKCFQISVLRGYGGKDKITLPESSSRKFDPLFCIYNHILKVIFELRWSVISPSIEIRPIGTDRILNVQAGASYPCITRKEY
jgi:hypothetical protein